jgi:hypothetical protein
MFLLLHLAHKHKVRPTCNRPNELPQVLDITKSALDAALTATALSRTASLKPNARGAVEHMQWIAAEGAAARVLGALADGVTPTEASLSTGVSMNASQLANMCEFVTLTNAGLDPGVARQSVGELNQDDVAPAVEVLGRERDRIRSLARMLHRGRRLDYVWLAKLAAYDPVASRPELHAAISKWTGISFERIFTARKLLRTLDQATPLRESGCIAGHLVAGEVPRLATLEPLGVFLELGGHVQPADKRETDQPQHEDLDRFSLTTLGGLVAEQIVGEMPRDVALVRAARDIAQFEGLPREMFGSMQPTQVFEMYERFVAECLLPHEHAIRAISAELERRGRLESGDLFNLGVQLGLLLTPHTVQGVEAP